MWPGVSNQTKQFVFGDATWTGDLENGLRWSQSTFDDFGADLRPLQISPGNLATVFANAQGRIIDWCHVIRTDDDLFLIGSPNRAGIIIAWLEQFTIMEDVTYMHLVD